MCTKKLLLTQQNIKKNYQKFNMLIIRFKNKTIFYNNYEFIK
jgi:hypothetical protein